MRKTFGFTLVTLLILAAVPMASADPLVFNFSESGNGSMLNFSGGNFSFVGGLAITSASGAWPNAAALLGTTGSITGTYAIGAININGPVQSAPVTGSGVFTLNAPGGAFTANVTWQNIVTIDAGGTINSLAVVNLTNIAYAGADPNFVALRNATGHSAVVTFQFNPARTLTSLKESGGSTSYSGTVTAQTAVPEPSTLILLGSGLLGIIGWRSRK